MPIVKGGSHQFYQLVDTAIIDKKPRSVETTYAGASPEDDEKWFGAGQIIGRRSSRFGTVILIAGSEVLCENNRSVTIDTLGARLEKE